MGNGHTGNGVGVSSAAMAAVVVALEGLTKEVRRKACPALNSLCACTTARHERIPVSPPGS